MSFLGYPKAIPYTKFEHWDFVVELFRTFAWKCTYWRWPFRVESSSSSLNISRISHIPRSFLYKVWTFWDLSFLIYSPDKQTNKLEHHTAWVTNKSIWQRELDHSGVERCYDGRGCPEWQLGNQRIEMSGACSLTSRNAASLTSCDQFKTSAHVEQK